MIFKLFNKDKLLFLLSFLIILICLLYLKTNNLSTKSKLNLKFYAHIHKS